MTVMANTSENVKGTYTVELTRSKCVIMVGCDGDRRRTGSILGAVRASNKRKVVCGTSISSLDRISVVVQRIRGGCKRVSILIGGTNVIGSRCLLVLGGSGLSRYFSLGIGNCFCYTRRTMLGVFHGGDNIVVGVSSIDKGFTVPKRDICDTAGNTVGSVAQAVTGRLTRCKVQIGTVTPNFVRARVLRSLPRRGGRTCLGLVPVRHLKGTDRMTSLMTVLISSSYSCVANRIVAVSKKVSL